MIRLHTRTDLFLAHIATLAGRNSTNITLLQVLLLATLPLLLSTLYIIRPYTIYFTAEDGQVDMVRIHGKNGKEIARSEVGLFREKEPEALQRLLVLILIINSSFIYRFPSIHNISKEG